MQFLELALDLRVIRYFRLSQTQPGANLQGWAASVHSRWGRFQCEPETAFAGNTSRASPFSPAALVDALLSQRQEARPVPNAGRVFLGRFT